MVVTPNVLIHQDPAAPLPWEGTRNASQPPTSCPQYDFSGMMNEPFAGQEDCLYLNVFTPKVSLKHQRDTL